MSKETGGPAFPRPASIVPGYTDIPWAQDGMALRQWYAGMALAGMCANSEISQWNWEDYAEHSFGIADAMLKEQERERSYE